MVKGILLYDKIDLMKNSSYIQWIKKSSIKYNICFDVYTNDEIIKDNRINELSKKYDFVLNRGRLYTISNEFEKLGINVFNSTYFCELGNDKLKAYNFIEEVGVEFSCIFKTANMLNYESLREVIVKPRIGHGGKGIYLTNEKDAKIDFNESNIYQVYIESYIGDVRFYIVNNEIINAVLRKPKTNSILSNFSKGGAVEIYKYSKHEKSIIEKILESIYIDYGAIDFILTNDQKLLFNEFEDVVGSRMLSYLGINNTVDLLLNHISKKIDQR